MLRRILLVVAAVTAFAVMAMPAAAAKSGNSANAKACQKGGWETQARTESPTTAFTSEQQCTSYAAKGGTLTGLQTSRTLQQICEDEGGLFWGGSGGADCFGGATEVSDADFVSAWEVACEDFAESIYAESGSAYSWFDTAYAGCEIGDSSSI